MPATRGIFDEKRRGGPRSGPGHPDGGRWPGLGNLDGDVEHGQGRCTGPVKWPDLRARLSRISESSRRISESLDFDSVIQAVFDSTGS